MAGIGLSKLYISKYSNSGTTVTYSDGILAAKLVSADIAVDTADNNDFYADNAIAETDRQFTGGTITVNTDDLSQATAKMLLGLAESEITGITGITDTGVKELIYDDDQNTPYVGIGMIIKKMVNAVIKWRAVILRKAMFDIHADSAETQGETINWQTPELSASFVRDDTAKHAWKSEATFTTEAQAEAYIKARLGITASAGSGG